MSGWRSVLVPLCKVAEFGVAQCQVVACQWHNVILLRQHECLSGTISGWHNAWVAKCPGWHNVLGGTVSGWHSVWVAQCLGGTVSGWRNVWEAKCLGGTMLGGTMSGGGVSGGGMSEDPVIPVIPCISPSMKVFHPVAWLMSFILG